MKEIQESLVRKDDLKAMNIWDCGSPLYDSYELVAVSHIVERHFMIMPYLSGSRNLPTDSSSVTSSSEKPKTAAEIAGKSSVISLWSEFVERNVLKKKKKKIDGGRKQKAVKENTGISKIFPWKK